MENNKNIDREIILSDIEKWAWLKYRLSGKRAMNTFIFSNSKKNNLSEDEINQLMDNLDRKIRDYIHFNDKKEQEENGIIHLCINGKKSVANL